MTGRALPLIASALCLVATAVPALDLALPVGARLTVERATTLDSFNLPTAAFDGNSVAATTLEGAITRRAWRISTAGLTPLQLMVPLREQLEEQGFDLVFECASDTCGGFDFRFGVEVLPGPNMYVNISRYRYLSATLGPQNAPAQAVGILVSVTAASAYVQVILADTGGDIQDALPDTETAPTEPVAEVPVPAAVAVVEDKLLENGFMILRDLEFATGTSDLSEGPYSSLARLAKLLQSRDDLRVALVGHTDAVGGLEPNIALSRERARSVRTRLVDVYGVAEDRLDAEGMGYLAPVASNLTAEGRDQNRRVEAILLNVER